MTDSTKIKPNEPPFSAAADWPRLVARASEALLEAMRLRGSLSPLQNAVLVARQLPRYAACRLIGSLRVLGWLKAEARIPFDVFERENCPISLGPGEREIWRLAVFGVCGQGNLSDAKRREAVFQQRCAEILREVRDLESLTYAAARALGHPEVNADPVLAGMLRAFIAEREAELRARAPIETQDNRHTHVSRSEYQEVQLPLRERVQRTLAKLRLELERHIGGYNEAGAAEVLIRIRDLRKRFPAQVETETVEECEQLVRRLTEKRDDFRQHLDELGQRAVEAVEMGDPKTATWVLRRFSAIHTLLPAVLPDDKLSEYHKQVRQSEQRQERHEAARNLVTRERVVGDEIKHLGAVIHHYHEMVQAKNVDPTTFAEAEAEYQRALSTIRQYDDEWLADLMIELDGLLEDLHGPRERAEEQVDRFVNNVRQAMQRMRAEIRQIQQSRTAS